LEGFSHSPAQVIAHPSEQNGRCSAFVYDLAVFKESGLQLQTYEGTVRKQVKINSEWSELKRIDDL
jgi:hypothetical protein